MQTPQLDEYTEQIQRSHIHEIVSQIKNKKPPTYSQVGGKLKKTYPSTLI